MTLKNINPKEFTFLPQIIQFSNNKNQFKIANMFQLFCNIKVMT